MSVKREPGAYEDGRSEEMTSERELSLIWYGRMRGLP